MAPPPSSRSHVAGARAAILLCFALAVRAVMATFPTFPTFADCPTGFANFGDSFTDTGGAANTFPYFLDCENSPYGETFFGAPAKRFSNGRLVPDFFSLGFRKPLLDAYVKPTSYEYQFGINFAQSGATAVIDPTTPAQNPIAVFPFQLNQFKRFVNSTVSTEAQPTCSNFFISLPIPIGTSWIPKWLFTISIGGNDFVNAIRKGAPNPNFAQIQATVVPTAVGGILQTIKELYDDGARKFLVFGLGPQGCSTLFLTLFPPLPIFPRDALGCITPINNVNQAFNAALLSGIQALQPNLTGANIAFFDYYAATIEIFQNPGTYGFTNLFTACCGAPGVGSLNYNPAITCGRPGSNVCPNPDQFANWDGVHFTEAYYKQIATFALNNRFTINGLNYTALCNLDFSKFPSSNTYNQVYPFNCQNIFA